nr:MAG TPA: hypothetical protein [Caudoviricetes sp.]
MDKKSSLTSQSSYSVYNKGFNLKIKLYYLDSSTSTFY